MQMPEAPVLMVGTDQDVVEELGQALGYTYEDNEPLRPEDKLEDRDRDRWELNPASAEDFGQPDE